MTKPIVLCNPSILSSAIHQDPSLLELPMELILSILKRLNPWEIGDSRSVCKQWYFQILQSDWIWQHLFWSHFPHFGSTKIPNYKQAYFNCYLLQSNLAQGVYASHYLKSFFNKIDCFVISNRKLITSSMDDKTIKIWDLDSFTSIFILEGHMHSVASLFTVDCKLGSCDSNGVIKIWDLDKYTCIATLEGGAKSIKSIAVFDGKLIMNLSDEAVWIWDLEKGCAEVLIGHSEGICAIVINEGYLISGSNNGTIKIWDLNKRICIDVLSENSESLKKVCSLAIADGKLISSYPNGTIKLWNLDDRSCVTVLNGHTPAAPSIVVDHGKLISGSWDGTIKIWDLATCICTNTLISQQRGAVTSIAVGNEVLFSGWENGMINVWNLGKGNCVATLKEFPERVSKIIYSEGMLFSITRDSTLVIWDFTANDQLVLEEIASLLEGGEGIDDSDNQDRKIALKRFARMPKTIKDQIYAESDISLFESSEFPNSNFHAQFGQISDLDLNGGAIRRYLIKQRRKDERYPLLEHLGIKTWDDYFTKLGCTPDDLEKIGILSAEDLNSILPIAEVVEQDRDLQIARLREYIGQKSSRGCVLQ